MKWNRSRSVDQE